jgi:MFS superfamily sulfate permease-like transporter
VVLIVVVEDPISGIILGSVVALLIFVRKMSYGQTEILLWKNGKFSESVLRNDLLERKEIDSDVVVYKISGNLTYVNMPAHLEAMERLKGNEAVIISMRHAFYVDMDGIDYLEEMVETLKENNKKVFLCGVNKEVEKQIKHKNFYKTKLIEGKIYNRISEALSEVFP